MLLARLFIPAFIALWGLTAPVVVAWDGNRPLPVNDGAALARPGEHKPPCHVDTAGWHIVHAWAEQTLQRLVDGGPDDSGCLPSTRAALTQQRRAMDAHRNHTVHEVSRRSLQTAGRHPPLA